VKNNSEHKTDSDDKKEIHPPDHGYDISLWIDSYDDIFSDFDQRPFYVRNISDDFLHEVKKVTQENNYHISELRLYIPEKTRNKETESTIMKRLHSHFHKNQHYFLRKKKTEQKRDLLLTFLGFSLMFTAGIISSAYSTHFFMHWLLVIIEPAGWFFVWIGMESIITSSRKEKPELDFYTKMHKSKITFLSV